MVVQQPGGHRCAVGVAHADEEDFGRGGHDGSLVAPWFVGTYPGIDFSGSASTPPTQNCRRYDAHSEDVASLPSGYGPRVQLSVFECQVCSQAELQSLRVQLALVDRPVGDQVRIYPTTAQTFSQRYILGARPVEERSDYWIVR